MEKSDYNTKADYLENFKDDSKKDEAFKHAADIRKFEIELYWKRTTYFWTLLAAIFAGYFLAISKSSTGKILPFLISNVGLTFSFAWYYVNRGSKYWQNNWEIQVDLLEDNLVGPLYKTGFSPDHYEGKKIFSPYPFSVSKINQILSFYVILIWLQFSIYSAYQYWKSNECFTANSILVISTIILTTVFILLLTIKGQTEKAIKNKPVEMVSRDYHDNT